MIAVWPRSRCFRARSLSTRRGQPVVGTDDDLKRLAQVVPGHRQKRDVKLVGAPEVVGDLLAVHDTLGLAHGYTYTACRPSNTTTF